MDRGEQLRNGLSYLQDFSYELYLKNEKLKEENEKLKEENNKLINDVQNYDNKEEERYNAWLKQNKEFLDRYLNENINIYCVNEYGFNVIKIYCGNNTIAKTGIL